MATLITDPHWEQQIQAERRATGADCYDEAWEGTQMMTPFPNNEHQHLVSRWTMVLGDVIEWSGLGRVLSGTNLSDREDDWTHNYRVPDVAVFLKDGAAKDFGTHWVGPADFLVEVVSPDDHSREKIPFYEQIGVRELLLIDRDPWVVELYRYADGGLALSGSSTLDDSVALASEALPLTFRLVPGDERPQIEVTHSEDGKQWQV